MGRLYPDRVVVFLDNDVLITGSLDPFVQAAEDGAIAVIADMRTRWFAEWEQTFELREPVRSSSSYADGSFVALSTSRWQWFLDRWYELSQQVAVSRAGQPFLLRWKEAESNPIGFNEQDIRNALLMSEVPEFAVGSRHTASPRSTTRGAGRASSTPRLAPRGRWQRSSLSPLHRAAENRGSRVAGSGSGSARSTGC